MPYLLDNTIVERPGHPGPVVLRKGTQVPEWAVGLLGAHLLDGGDVKALTRPPVEGAGSSAKVWRAYAESLGIDSTGTKAEIIDRIDANVDPTDDEDGDGDGDGDRKDTDHDD